MRKPRLRRTGEQWSRNPIAGIIVRFCSAAWFEAHTDETLRSKVAASPYTIGAISEAQWKWLLKGRLKQIASMADLVRVFRNRQPPIAALDARIARTDALIDAIVYALYGLTSDEIALVEGRELRQEAVGTPS